MRLAALLALLAVAAVAAAPCARQCAGPAPNGPCVVADFLGNATGAVAAYQLVALTAPLAVTWFGHVTYAAGALPSGTAFFSGTSAVFYPATGGGAAATGPYLTFALPASGACNVVPLTVVTLPIRANATAVTAFRLQSINATVATGCIDVGPQLLRSDQFAPTLCWELRYPTLVPNILDLYVTNPNHVAVTVAGNVLPQPGSAAQPATVTITSMTGKFAAFTTPLSTAAIPATPVAPGGATWQRIVRISFDTPATGLPQLTVALRAIVGNVNAIATRYIRYRLPIAADASFVTTVAYADNVYPSTVVWDFALHSDLAVMASRDGVVFGVDTTRAASAPAATSVRSKARASRASRGAHTGAPANTAGALTNSGAGAVVNAGAGTGTPTDAAATPAALCTARALSDDDAQACPPLEAIQGNWVGVVHGDGTLAVYSLLAHNGSAVAPGDVVVAGQQLGLAAGPNGALRLRIYAAAWTTAAAVNGTYAQTWPLPTVGRPPLFYARFKSNCTDGWFPRTGVIIPSLTYDPSPFCAAYVIDPTVPFVQDTGDFGNLAGRIVGGFATFFFLAGVAILVVDRYGSMPRRLIQLQQRRQHRLEAAISRLSMSDNANELAHDLGHPAPRDPANDGLAFTTATTPRPSLTSRTAPGRASAATPTPTLATVRELDVPTSAVPTTRGSAHSRGASVGGWLDGAPPPPRPDPWTSRRVASEGGGV